MFLAADLIDIAKALIIGICLFVILLLSPFVIAHVYDSLRSDLGPVWTESTNSGFMPENH